MGTYSYFQRYIDGTLQVHKSLSIPLFIQRTYPFLKVYGAENVPTDSEKLYYTGHGTEEKIKKFFFKDTYYVSMKKKILWIYCTSTTV